MVAFKSKFGIDPVGDHEQIVPRKTTSAILSNSVRIIVPPVGLVGKFKIKTLLRGVMTRLDRVSRDGETILRLAGNRHGHAMRHGDTRRVTDIARLVIEDFVPRIDHCAQREVQRLTDFRR